MWDYLLLDLPFLLGWLLSNSIGLFVATFISIYEIGWVKIFHTFKQESAFNPILNSDFGYDYILDFEEPLKKIVDKIE